MGRSYRVHSLEKEKTFKGTRYSIFVMRQQKHQRQNRNHFFRQKIPILYLPWKKWIFQRAIRVSGLSNRLQILKSGGSSCWNFDVNDHSGPSLSVLASLLSSRELWSGDVSPWSLFHALLANGVRGIVIMIPSRPSLVLPSTVVLWSFLGMARTGFSQSGNNKRYRISGIY